DVYKRQVYVNTYGTARVPLSDADIAARIQALFDLRPAAIIEHLQLQAPIYRPTAAYGHMGRHPSLLEYTHTTCRVEQTPEGPRETYIHQKHTAQTFPWEKLDQVERLREAFAVKETFPN
ncbi:MAG: methionine adenosyltransferase domain-containing protein, partial [Bacteroidia bacterium]|nr:methionine adenosyltransferase domain-containing protein [Bacteroidia bacterium]